MSNVIDLHQTRAAREHARLRIAAQGIPQALKALQVVVRGYNKGQITEAECALLGRGIFGDGPEVA